jgi:hypothetical protein
MPGSIKIDDGSGNYTILTNAGSLGSDKTLTIPNTTGTLATTTDVNNVTPGVTEADIWRITANVTVDTPNGFITANWERGDARGANYFGTGLTESSGVFSFPSTGYYLINYHWSVLSNGGNHSFFININTTLDNSSYNPAVGALGFVSSTANMYGNVAGSFIFDVTDTSLCKFKFGNGNITGTAGTIRGDTNEQLGGFTCVRLGDT